jgi:hypothetical protein
MASRTARLRLRIPWDSDVVPKHERCKKNENQKLTGVDSGLT